MSDWRISDDGSLVHGVGSVQGPPCEGQNLSDSSCVCGGVGKMLVIKRFLGVEDFTVSSSIKRFLGAGRGGSIRAAG